MSVLTLSEQIQRDMELVFLNPSEFAVPVDLGEGVVVNGIWSDRNETYNKYHKGNVQHLPIVTGVRILYLQESALDVSAKQQFFADGQYYFVEKVSREGGMLRLELYRDEDW